MNYDEVRKIIEEGTTKEQMLQSIDHLEQRSIQKVMSAMSYTETMIITTIARYFREKDTLEDTFTVSDLTTREGVSRSIGVNAIRKLESAGLLESRSLGMKGTRIRITNKKLLEWSEN